MQDANILRKAFSNYLENTANAMEKAVIEWEEVTSGDGIELEVLEKIFGNLIKSLATEANNGMAFMQEHEINE